MFLVKYEFYKTQMPYFILKIYYQIKINDKMIIIL